MAKQAWRMVMGLALAAVGCSGSSPSSGSESCSTFAACGGDVAGTWKVTATCVTVDSSALMGSCAGATASYALDTQGTVAFAPEGTYKNDIALTTKVHVTVPPACIQPGGSCASVETSIAMTYGTSHCTGDATIGCTCDAQDTQASNETGHYAVTGSQLTQTSDAPGAAPNDPAEFCVKSNVLTVHQSSGPVVATYVATKQ